MEKKNKLAFNILAVFLIIMFVFAICPVTMQNDTYYTVKIGEHILNDGIEYMDVFSWHEGLPYTYPHWLYDVIMYLIYSIGGFTGIYISTVCFASILGILIYYTNNLLNKNRVVSFLVTLLTMYLLRDYIAARAQLITFILFTLTILFIEKFLQKGKKRYLIPLIIIPILIANLHSATWPFYFVLFIPYITEALVRFVVNRNIVNSLIISILKFKLNYTNSPIEVSEINAKISKLYEKNRISIAKRKEKEKYKIDIGTGGNIIPIAVIAVIAILTGLCTPLGDTPYTYLIKTMQGNTTHNINEHLPLILFESKEMFITIAIFIAVLTFTKVKIKLRDLFMIMGLTFLSFASRRQISMLVLIGNYIFAKMFVDLIGEYKIFKNKKLGNIFSNKICMIVVTFLVIGSSIWLFKPKMDDTYVDATCYPVAACDYIINNLDVSKIRLYNEYNYGSYILYRGIPVFIDSRADLYSPEFNGKKNEEGKYEGRDIFSDFLNISGIATYYEKEFEEYGITHVMMNTNAKLDLLISRDEKYTEIYRDDYFVIYERLN